MVPGKDPLRVQFAGTPELRVLSAWRPNDLSRSNAGGAFDLRCAEAPYFSVRIPGTVVVIVIVVVSEVEREFLLAEATAVQHGNMEAGRPSLFRNWRCQCRGHRQSGEIV